MMVSETELGRGLGKAVKRVRLAVGLSGVLSLAIGILMLIWPDKSAIVFTVLLGVYALLVGIVYIAVGVSVRELGGVIRTLHVLAGVLFVATAVIAFTNPATSAVSFAVVVVIFIGVSWIVEAVAALSTIGAKTSAGWAVAYAVVSLIGGIILVLSPLTGAVVFWAWIAAIAIVLGIAQIVRAIRL